MGQYYYILAREEGKNHVVYNRDLIIDGKKEYVMAKLMEHSWWENQMVNAICEKIYNADKPIKVIWMGDYADGFIDEDEHFNNLSYQDIQRYYKRCWGDRYKGRAIKATEFTLNGKYLINHTKRKYINCSKYYQNSRMQTKYNSEWCIHPLPILTCIGNGLGGGDYNYPTEDSHKELVGAWAWDKLSIEDEPAPQYEELCPIFKEKGWEE